MAELINKTDLVKTPNVKSEDPTDTLSSEFLHDLLNGVSVNLQEYCRRLTGNVFAHHRITGNFLGCCGPPQTDQELLRVL